MADGDEEVWVGPNGETATMPAGHATDMSGHRRRGWRRATPNTRPDGRQIAMPSMAAAATSMHMRPDGREIPVPASLAPAPPNAAPMDLSGVPSMDSGGIPAGFYQAAGQPVPDAAPAPAPGPTYTAPSHQNAAQPGFSPEGATAWQGPGMNMGAVPAAHGTEVSVPEPQQRVQGIDLSGGAAPGAGAPALDRGQLAAQLALQQLNAPRGGGGPRTTQTTNSTQTVLSPEDVRRGHAMEEETQFTAAVAEEDARDLAGLQAQEQAGNAQQLSDLQTDLNVQSAQAELDAQDEQLALADQRRRIESAVADVREGRIDSTRLFGGSHTGARITAGLAIAMGQLGAQLTGGTNVALAMVNERIDRDISEQATNLEQGQAGVVAENGVYAQLLAETGNATAARETARAQMLEHAALEAERMGASAQDAQIRQNFEAQASELRKQAAAAAEAAFYASRPTMTIERVQRTGGGGRRRPSVSEAQAMADLQVTARHGSGPADGEEGVSIPGLTVVDPGAANALGTEGTNRVRVQSANHRNFERLSLEYIALLEETTPAQRAAGTLSVNASRLNSVRLQLMFSQKSLVGPGAISDGERLILEQITPGSDLELALTSSVGLVRRMRTQIRAEADNYFFAHGFARGSGNRTRTENASSFQRSDGGEAEQ